MKVGYLVKRWNHHTASGGYDCLARREKSVVARRAEGASLASRLLGFAWRKLYHPTPYLLDYRYGDWLAEWSLLAKASVGQIDVLHALYGDDQLNVLLEKKRMLRCALVATFHFPAERDFVKLRFEQSQKHLLGGIDAAVVVGRSQLPDFQKWLGPDRVVYIPHGIDTRRFHPDGKRSAQETVRLVSVGDHMRDFEAMHRIVDECNRGDLGVEFDFVVPKHIRQFFYGCKNARFHSGISEEKLIGLYCQADALLLPVADATANNAVLEAMACGTPVISTAIGGIPDYVDASAGWLFPPGEVDEIVSLIGAGCENRDVFVSRRAGARAKALEFDWKQIERQMSPLYEAVSSGRPIDLSNNAMPAIKLKKPSE